jgi:RimJ/RimL family protein N-acetyltransferase
VVIETERLLLRPLARADVDEFVALHADPEVARFVRRFERPEAEDRLRLVEREWAERGHGMLAVLDRLSGRFLGRVGLKYWPQLDETEVGWVLRRDAWGQGYATEAARACLDWGFGNLAIPYLTAMIHPDNAASIRVARRLGLAVLSHRRPARQPGRGLRAQARRLGRPRAVDVVRPAAAAVRQDRARRARADAACRRQC